MTQKSTYLAWESGHLKGDAEAEFFQELVDTGALADLPRKYRDRADALIARGEVFLDPDSPE